MKNKRFEIKILVKTVEQFIECGKKEFRSNMRPKYCPNNYLTEKKGFVACFHQPRSIYCNQYFWGKTREEALRRMFKEVDWK